MKTWRRALERGMVAGLLASFATISACSADGEAAAESSNDSGAVRAALTFPGGDTISAVHWEITGPNGASTVVQQGTAELQDASTLTLMIGGLPRAAGYVITLSGTSDAGSTCVGAAQFSVVARTTANVSASLSCAAATADAGVVAVTGKAHACPSVTGVWAMPSEVMVGHSIALAAAAATFDGGAIRYTWSAPSGSFGTVSEATTTFTCAMVGTVPVTVAVSDGASPDGGTCNAAFSAGTVLVTCSAPVDAAGP